jgi:hypothetical protein
MISVLRRCTLILLALVAAGCSTDPDAASDAATATSVSPPTTVSIDGRTDVAGPLVMSSPDWRVAVGATGSCKVDDPCGDVRDAIDVSEDGDVIELAAGEHDEVVIDVDGAPTGLVVQGEAGGGTEVNGIVVSIPDVTVQNLTSHGSVHVLDGGDDVHLRHLTTDTGTVFISASRVTLSDSRIEPSIDLDGIQIKPHPPSSPVPVGTVVERNVVGPIVASPDTTHIDGIQLLEAQDTVIRQNIVFDCASQCIIGGEGNSGLLIERNVIALADDNGGYNAINLQNIPGLTFAFNSVIRGTVVLSASDEDLDVRSNNISSLETCGAFLVDNVVQRSSCRLPDGNSLEPIEYVDPFAQPPDAEPVAPRRASSDEAPLDLYGNEPCAEPTVGAIEVCQ